MIYVLEKASIIYLLQMSPIQDKGKVFKICKVSVESEN